MNVIGRHDESLSRSHAKISFAYRVIHPAAFDIGEFKKWMQVWRDLLSRRKGQSMCDFDLNTNLVERDRWVGLAAPSLP